MLSSIQTPANHPANVLADMGKRHEAAVFAATGTTPHTLVFAIRRADQYTGMGNQAEDARRDRQGAAPCSAIGMPSGATTPGTR